MIEVLIGLGVVVAFVGFIILVNKITDKPDDLM